MYAHTCLALFLTTFSLIAQEGAAAPDPDTGGHRALAQFVGTWDCAVTIQVPGADKPAEMKATERVSVVSGGLWLKSVVQGTAMGQPFEGLTVMGFDPHAKKYFGIWIDSQSPSAARSEGTYDPATKTWELVTLSGDGPSRTVFTFHDADRSTEIGYAKGPDGKEVEIMRIQRTRAADNTPTTTGPADTEPTPGTSAVGIESAPAEAGHPIAAILRRLPGSWTCTMQMPDGVAIPAREQVSAVCGGGWFWSDFNAPGAIPFEGHALWGYDVRMNHFVSYWIDSTSPGLTELTGHFDEKTNVLTLHGHSIDSAGEKQRLHETIEWPSEHQRVLTMDFSTGARNLRMTLTYEREQSTGGFQIK